MKTLYLSAVSNILVDTENGKADMIPENDRYDVQRVYYIEEPMHVIFGLGDEKSEFDAKKGDIILTFYNRQSANAPTVALVKSPAWSKRIKAIHAYDQKQKEEWAARKAETDCEKCCAECDCCVTAEVKPAKTTKKVKKTKKA